MFTSDAHNQASTQDTKSNETPSLTPPERVFSKDNAMALVSNLFRGDKKLEACLVNDAAHVTLGARGEHVAKI